MGDVNNQPTSEFELWAEVNGFRQRLTSLNVGLLLFTPIPFNESAREHRQMFDAYLSLVSKATFRWQNLGGTSKEYKGVTRSAFARIDSWLALRKPYGWGCAIWLKDGREVTDTGDYLFRLWGRDTAATEGDSNFLLMLFPLDCFGDPGRDSFVSQLHNVIHRLPFYSGYLGYFLNVSTLRTVSGYSNDIAGRSRAVGRRFVGVEMTNPVLENYEMAKVLRSPAWITLLGKKFVEELGGDQALRQQLVGSYRFRALEHGLSVQAGAKPLFGDRNRGEHVSEEQRKLAQIMSQFYSQKPAKLFGRWDNEDTAIWIRRLL